MNERIVLCIPGPWATEEAFQAAMRAEAPDFEVGGGSLMESATDVIFAYEFETADDRLPAAFQAVGAGRLGDDVEARLNSHRSVVYLIQDSVGPASVAVTIQAAEAVLDAGGIAVKVETSGVAFSPSAWRKFAESDEPTDLYAAFVAHAYDDTSAYTCGMHNLGLPDSCVAGLDPRQAVRLLETFNLYQLLDSPTMTDGQTFAVAHNAPVFRLSKAPCQTFPADHLYHNPYGVWTLTAVG